MTESSTPDQAMMARALQLAQASTGLASPNPQVGCVLVRDRQILGEGAHLYDARDHAEIVALKAAASAGHDVRGATAYVTLEPCSHHGRTGPCADALIAAGITRCVVATVDPNPNVSGEGLRRMRAAGIAVEIIGGELEQKARRLNNAFAFSIQHHRPFVTLKSALSADGRLAPLPAARPPGAPFWLTGPEARAEVQRLRHASDALITGIGTLLADDPHLTDRTGLPRRRPLLRVILDARLEIPLTSNLVTSAQDNVLIIANAAAPPDRKRRLEEAGVVVELQPETKRIDLHALLASLHQRQILSVLLEAGPALNGAFLAANLVEEAILFFAPTGLGPHSLPFSRSGPDPFTLTGSLTRLDRRTFGPDTCLSGLLHDPWAPIP